MMRYGFLIAASLAVLAATIDAQQPDVATANSKLTTVLADLVAAQGNSTTQLAESSRPSSVQNAMRSRRLRIDANNEVQVYILMNAVSDDSVSQLTAAGVTIEIRDAARRRVQAHLPVSRLTAVAQLAVVDAIRLPTYTRARTGNTLSEGDAILHADAARAQLGLDGTGVRVGVISDGLKGVFATGGVDGTSIPGISTPGHLHLFQRTADTTDVLGLGAQPFNVISLPQNGEVAIFLTWDDPFGGSANNYDLYLVQQSTGRVVASSTDVQSGRQDPSETIDYVNAGAADRFYIVVQNVRGAAQPKTLNIFSFQPECAAAGPALLAPPRHERHNYNTASRSVSAQGDAGGSPVSVIAAGAICSASAAAAGAFSGAPDESCLDTSNTTPEFFSSRGPTLDGRLKPDLVAIDGVSVSGAGSFPVPFFGTSAAAPHVGAIAALVLQSAPCLLNRSTSTATADTARTTIRNLLVGKTVPIAPTPDDNVGGGRVDALSAAQATLPGWKGSHTLTVDANSTFGATLTGEQLGFVDPNGCGLKSLNWTGGCGTAPGPNMTCPAGANVVSVAASNNGVTYSGSVDFTINVTDFAMSTAPDNATVSAGQSSRHVVTVASQGGIYNSQVTLSCNSGTLPPQTTCTFDPAVITPGAAGAQSTLTISTASAASTQSAATQRTKTGPITIQSSGIAVFPSALTFGAQTLNTTSPAQLVSVTNTGVDVLNITSITPSGDFAVVSNCGSTVASGASCAVSVSFTPTAAGSRTGSLSFVDDATGSPHTVTLTGTGQTAPSSTGGTPSGSYTVTVTGTAGTSLAHVGTVTLTVK